jgi:membrane protein
VSPIFRHAWFHRERLRAFAVFIWQRFLDDRCPQTAGALAFTTLFALVPLTAAVLGVLSAFPVFQEWRAQVTDFVFDNFVPSAGKVVQTYLTTFADNASQATLIGVLVLLFSSISLMMSIEDAFNRIWRVATPRRATARFLVYWTALSLGPVLLVAAMAISSYLFALPLIEQVDSGLGLKARLLGALPFLIVWLALSASYLLIPNRRVRPRDALIGALLAALGFEFTKRGFAWYLASVPSYEKVYGTLAVIPIFLVWIYLSWLVVLLGASLTAAATAFEYRDPDEQLPVGQEFLGLLCVLRQLLAAQREGRGLHSSALRAALPFLNDDALQAHLAALHGADLARRSEAGEWLLSRDPASATLTRVYELGRYRVPLDPQVPLPGGCDPAPELLQRLRSDLSSALALPLAAIFPVVPRSDTSSASLSTPTPSTSVPEP